MGQVQGYTQSVHLPYYLLALLAKPPPIILFTHAIGQLIAVIPGQSQTAQPQVVEQMKNFHIHTQSFSSLQMQQTTHPGIIFG